MTRTPIRAGRRTSTASSRHPRHHRRLLLHRLLLHRLHLWRLQPWPRQGLQGLPDLLDRLERPEAAVAVRRSPSRHLQSRLRSRSRASTFRWPGWPPWVC